MTSDLARELRGKELGPTGWLELTQERIDAFAAATGDAQWIHVDPERAAAGPFGATVAHGFLTLALCPVLLAEVLDPPGLEVTVNYGLERVRFPAPVPAGSRVRGRLAVTSAQDVAGGVHLVLAATVEREGGEKPVCVADLVLRLLTLPERA